MANSFIDIVRLVEAHVPQAKGGASYDDVLRSSITGFANQVIDEIDREQRWSLSYAEPYFTTTQGTEQYALPYPLPAAALGQTTQLFIKRVYYTDATGRPVPLGRVDQYEAQRLYGESAGLGASATAPPQGKPTKYAIIPSTSTTGGIDQGNPQMTILLYPTPDASGPETSGNFKIRVQGYWKTPPIWETVGNVATNTTLTFATPGSGSYLTANGVAANGSQWNLFLAVRGGGNVTGITQTPNDTHISTWTALAANTATLTTAAPITATNLATYFNATNWIIQHWPRLLIYGICREIGNYYKKQDMLGIFEAQYQQQLDKLRAYEWDRARGVELLMSAVAGQNGSPFRVNDLQSFLDIRGGGSW